MEGVQLVVVIVLHCATGVAGNLLRGVEVPMYAFAGGHANLSCAYDLRATRLYSLKWYHNRTEFYRYVPTERDQPINIQPSHKFAVHELFRSEQRVSLSLSRLQVTASGQYRCEVIAEHPSFRTEAAAAAMVVLREPLHPPELVGAREIYEPSELIKVGCQLRQSFPGAHQPSLQWFLQGSQVEKEWVSHYGNTNRLGHYGLSLHVPGQQVAAAGGSLQAECRLRLGPLRQSVFKTLRVRMRMISYVDNYQSSGSRTMATSSVVVLALVLVTLM